MQLVNPLSVLRSIGDGLFHYGKARRRINPRTTATPLSTFGVAKRRLRLSARFAPRTTIVYEDLLKQSRDVFGMFDIDQRAMKEVTMSMYPGATSQPAHWKSFADMTSVVNPSDVEGWSGESDDSDSDDISDRVSGLSTLISTFRWNLPYTCRETYLKSTRRFVPLPTPYFLVLTLFAQGPPRVQDNCLLVRHISQHPKSISNVLCAFRSLPHPPHHAFGKKAVSPPIRFRIFR